jgi:Holliday junction resolvasome RuvABC DNA-binding subunit
MEMAEHARHNASSTKAGSEHAREPSDSNGGIGKANSASRTLLEKVYRALTGLGFRDREARRAVAEIERSREGLADLEHALRAALWIATARAA